MSHSVVHEAVFAETAIFEKALARMGATMLGQGRHELYDGEYNGLGFRLPRWNYPLVLQSDNRLIFDDYNGKWGKVEDIDRLKQMYQIELARDEYTGLGTITETALEDGSIKLKVLLGAGAGSVGSSGSAVTKGGTHLE